MLNNYILISNGIFISEDELYHHGVKGMKWGVRRYQNKDGSLTNRGKKRQKILLQASDKAKELSDMARKDSEVYRKKAESYKSAKLSDSQYQKAMYDLFGNDSKIKGYADSEAKSMGYKDSKHMAREYLGIGKEGSNNFKTLSDRAKKAADFYSKLSDSYKNTPISALNRKQVKRAKKFVEHAYLENVRYDDYSLTYNQKKYGL